MYETLLFGIEGSIATITINRPDKLNALNKQVLTELDQCLNAVAGNEELRVLIITGAGAKAFVAGADIAELSQESNETGEAFSVFGQGVFAKIENLGLPVIAAVNGFALGGGCELALACHIRLAATSAKFGQPEVNLGIIPGYGGTQRLTRVVGRGNSLFLTLTGTIVSAEEALRMGLVSGIYPPDELALQAQKLALTLASKAPLALATAIDVILAAEHEDDEFGYAQEASGFSELCGTEDFREGTTAFLEKRQAKFQGL